MVFTRPDESSGGETDADSVVDEAGDGKGLIQNLTDRDLDILVRMFERQVQHVHIVLPDDPLRPGPDLQTSPNERFSVVKLQNNMERFCASIGMGLLRTTMEIHRIREWMEVKRSGIALLVYSAAWFYGRLLTALILFLSVLASYPPSRRSCFPESHRLSPTLSSSTAPGRPVSPMMSPGVSGTESNRTEQWSLATAEVKAAQWVETVMDLLKALSVPIKQGDATGNDEYMSGRANDVEVRDMLRVEGSSDESLRHGQESRKEDVLETYGRPAMRIIGGLADKWERAANCLSGTPPFSAKAYSFRNFGWFLPVLLLTFVPGHLVAKTSGLLIGFVVFGKPISRRVVNHLDRYVPRWKETLILEYNIFSDVPTNAQLVLSLYRDAEHSLRPLPTPSAESAKFGMTPVLASGGDITLKKAQTKDMQRIVYHTVTGIRARLRRIWDTGGILKEETFAWMTGRKIFDNKPILERVHIRSPNSASDTQGEKEGRTDKRSRFYVHHAKHGPGHIIIHPPTASENSPTMPARVTFTTMRHIPAAENVRLDGESEPSAGHLTVSINDVISLKKEGMTMAKRILTSLALDTDGVGGTGLEIRVIRRESGNERTEQHREGREEVINLKSIVRRDELFGRLISLGEQQWEML